MKSQQQDNILRTSCKHCVLAVYHDKTQVGCVANRIEKFNSVIEAYDDELEFYVVEELCNFYRDNRVNPYINNNDEIDLEKIRYESSISFDVLVDCNNINEEYLQKISHFATVSTSNYAPQKIKFHLLYSKISKEQKIQIIKLKNRLDCAMTFCSDNTFVHNYLMKSRLSYHLFLNRENVVSDDNMNLLHKINNRINEDLKKCLVIKCENVSAISNLAYKIEHLKIANNKYDSIVSNIIQFSKDNNLYQNI